MRDETRRKIDKAVKISLIIAGILLIANDIYWRLHGASTRTGADNNSPAQQVNRAAELNQQAGAAVKSAAGAVERAEQRAESAAAANQSAQAGVNDCKKLVDELRQDNRRAKHFIDELIRGTQTGAAQDAAH
ncbi:hypothetical protein [uncultured Phascolarctobacterium sp.]|uniref:hypothetical protein n=1 Tax=uncultured Phascolarctobacterium sp. TaxID=512296 RepID=UPI0025EFB3CF|nr:hypothetical protein [uncultured Phascolarctobacterium sp.]